MAFADTPMRPINIQPYRATDAEACARLFNSAFRSVPAFCPVDAATLHHGLSYPAPTRSAVSTPEALICTRRGGAVVGLVAYCQRQRDGEARPHGLVRLLCYPVKEPEIGRALLGQALVSLKTYTVPFVAALHGGGGFVFHNFSNTHLLESQQDLVPVLLQGGLRLRPSPQRTLIMGVRLPIPTRLRQGPAEITALEGGRQPYSCQALVAGEPAGECWAELGSAYSSHPDATQVAFVTWVGTREGLQGRGIAGQMLLWSLARLEDAGVRRVYLNTQGDNTTAQALYFSAGFRIVDRCLDFEASIDTSPVTEVPP